jgi:GAF domain-containing protein
VRKVSLVLGPVRWRIGVIGTEIAFDDNASANLNNNNNLRENNNTASISRFTKEVEFRDASVGIIGSVVTSGQSITVPVASDHEDYKAVFDARIIAPDKACMVMPLQSSRGRDVVIGALAFSTPKHAQTRFLVQDQRLGSDFATFCSIAIEQCYEVQRLHVSKEGMLQAFPTLQMDRIIIKAGWQTVRNWVASLRRQKKARQSQQQQNQNQNQQQTASEL